jgi:hypothetical protein
MVQRKKKEKFTVKKTFTLNPQAETLDPKSPKLTFAPPE